MNNDPKDKDELEKLLELVIEVEKTTEKINKLVLSFAEIEKSLDNQVSKLDKMSN